MAMVGEATTAAYSAIHAAKYPIGQLGTPEDIAWAIVYLASDESRFMPGAEMVVDGGYLAQG